MSQIATSSRTLRIATLLLFTASLLVSGLAFAQDSPQQTTRANDPQSPVQRTWVMVPTFTGVTEPLYTMKYEYQSKGFYEAEPVKLPPWLQNPAPGDPQFVDKRIQRYIGPLVGVTSGLSFDGIGNGFVGPNGTYSVGSVPPDTDMATGTTQVVSLDNTAFAIFNKSTGAVVGGPYNTNVLWSALGTSAACDADNDGDGVVKFDQLAQRWLITQFAVTAGGTTGPFAQCVAISQTADATGSWTVFQFNPSVRSTKTDFPDYPKISVWPDAYSMTFDMFNAAGTTYEGAGICGIDRIALLAGNNPTIVCAQLTSSDYALLPVDLDGATYPASGAKELYIENSDSASTSTSLYMYRAKYNFTGGTVTVDSRITITVSTYSNATCANTQKCAVQPTHTGTVQNGTFASESKLDTLAAHEMYRAAYRNFGTYESVLLSGPVLPSGSGGSGSNTAERWYEIRTPFGTPTVYQQSTYSPDTSLYRWMGSIAQDVQGNILMGYSGSSSSVFPSVYVTGRLNADTLNTMESELKAYAGLNSQVNLTGYAYGYRWGDYTSMMMDPDDCTFWYTGEYLKAAGLFNWSTRVLSFSFPGCTSKAGITSPVPSSTLTSSSATFLWLSGTGTPSYQLAVGSTQGGNNYCGGTQSYSAGVYTATLSACLPVDGSTFWVRLTTVGGAGGFNDYQYTAASLAQSTVTTVSSNLNPSTYGQSVNFTATVTSSGNPVTVGTVQFVVDGSNFGSAVALNGSGQAASGFTSTLTATTHSVQANYSGSGSYQASNGSLTQTVSKKAASVTPNPATKVYGQSDPTLTGTLSGFLAGDGVTATYSRTSGETVAGSPYTISATLSPTGVLGNYTITYNTANFTITAALLTVTANNAGMIYGGAVPTLSYGITGFQFSDNQGNSTTGVPAESTTATSGSPVGVYAISISQGTLAATNYSFGFVNGSLTIGPATLTVTADPKTATEGDGLPVFTASYSGFVNGDNQGVLTGAPAFSTDAPSGPPVGTWNIFVTVGTLADPNYTFSFVNGVLTVNPAVAQFTAPPKNTMFSGSTVNFTWSHETGANVYQLNLGSTPGGQNIASYQTTNLAATLSNLATDGSYVYATLLGSTDGGNNFTTQDTATYVANGPIAVMINPLPGATFAGSTVTFNWVAGASSSAYWLDLGPNPGSNDYYQSGNLGSALTTTVNNLPSDGSQVYATLWSLVNGSWTYNEYTYTAYNNSSIKGTMQTPTPGSTLAGTSVLFTWSAGTQSTAYWLDAGSTQGGNQYYQSGNLGTSLNTTATNLPSNGSPVYVTLYSLVNGQWVYNQYTYTAYSAGQATGVITTPTPGSQFAGTTVTFDWTAGTGSSAYWLDIGNVPGGNQYYQSGNLGNVLTTTASNLPSDGSPVYVTLYSLVGGQWIANAYTYTAFSASSSLGVMQTPPPGTTINGNGATFTWSAGTGATAYWLDIGNVVGGNQYYQSGNLGNVLTITVNSLPADGSTIYVTLYSLVGGQWLSNPYTYTSAP